MVAAQKPHLLLITPPPVDEHALEAYRPDSPLLSRKAEVTRDYAETCQRVGENLGVAVLDLWTIIMTKTGWKPGEPLIGSKSQPPSKILQEVLRDGEILQTSPKFP